MDLDLTGEQKMLAKSAEAMLADKAPAEGIPDIAKTDLGFDDSVYELMASLGWTSLALDAEDGGSLLELGIILTELGKQATAVPFLASMSAGLTLTRLGKGDELSAAVDRIIEGKPAALVVGPELASRSESGRTKLSGSVTAVEWPTVANELVVVSGNGDEREVFLIDPNQTGITITVQSSMDNERLGLVDFDEVDVSHGPVGRVDRRTWRGHVHLLRLLRAAEMLGGEQRVLQMTVDHVKQREQFGRAIGMFQAVQHHLANILIDVDGSEFLVNQALWRASVDLPFERQAAMAAWHVGDAAVRATQTANQLHGGIGFMKEFHLHHFFHRAMAQRSRMGSVQERATQLGDVVVEAAERGFHPEFVEWPVIGPEGMEN